LTPIKIIEHLIKCGYGNKFLFIEA